MFDIFYIGENNSIQEKFPFSKCIKDKSEAKPNTKMYWLIEPNITITDINVFEFRPDRYQDGFAHFWKWNDLNYGGVSLHPKNSKDVETVYHNKVVCKKSFNILDTETPEDYFEKNKYATHVWCVDSEYKLADDINWAPGDFEPNFIHSFHLRGQLEHKYPKEEGGIKLFPRNWKEADVKYHTYLDANVTYPILYVKDVDDYTQRDIFDDEYVWLIDFEYKINAKSVDWVPSPFEDGMIHAFRMPYQLTEKYPMAMGGIRLVPKNWRQEISPAGIYTEAPLKIHPACPIEDENYDIFYVDENEFTAESFRDYSERSKTDWFWIVDRDFEFNGKLLFVPAEHEREYIHVFKIPGHLDFRYPEDFTDPWDFRCGGVRLVHKDFDYTKHKYQDGVVPVRYDIFFVDNPQDFDNTIKKSRTKMFWSIDSEHSISQVLNYVPTRDEQKYLLNFKITDQLVHKYPEKEGGVYLVPTSINENTSKKYKGSLHVKVQEFPILYVDDVEDLSIVTQDCWLVDKEYQIDNEIDWCPPAFEMTCQHTFHVPNQLKHKYPEKMGGVRWVPKEWNGEYVIHDDVPVKPKRYPILVVDDPDDYSQAIGECWLIDKDYIIDENFEWVPSNFEKDFIHTFHVQGQLEHKYPEDIGGVRWVPYDWENAETKIHSESPFTKPIFERYQSEEEGRKLTTQDWFWVIDPQVEPLKEFDFSYIPSVWDTGKTHVWQILNPKTGRQFDYGGISLCPKVPNENQKRPKYMREPACVQIEYPVYHLHPEDYKDGLQSVYVRLSTQSKTDMYWVIDSFTQISDDFAFDYYPTQWDKKSVHVFLNEDNTYRNVRLVPKQTFLDKEYSDKEIANNSFEHLKQINTIASLKPKWPVVHLQSLERNEIINAIKEAETPFIWTIDPDVKVNQDVLDNGFMPKLTDVNKIHAWQKVNQIQNKVHAYGGLRLWPTLIDYTNIKSDDIKFNKFRNLEYVREPGSRTKLFDVVFLSYKEPFAEKNYVTLQDKLRTSHPELKLIWIKDVEGIFNAHKEGAKRVQSKMFWVVDADAQIHEDFNFDYIPDVYDEEVVHVWSSENPITKDKYGYGGVKLFPTHLVRESTSWGLDFTTGLSKRFRAVETVSCITKFNTDPFSTWRSAFRECVKLTLNDDAESLDRLNKWLNAPGGEYVEEAIKGAQEGNQFALEHKNDLESLNKINDFKWLKGKYNGS